MPARWAADDFGEIPPEQQLGDFGEAATVVAFIDRYDS